MSEQKKSTLTPKKVWAFFNRMLSNYKLKSLKDKMIEEAKLGVKIDNGMSAETDKGKVVNKRIKKLKND